MVYQVKEIFYTLQGEGVNAGRSAVFCRFAGCNLWSGRIQDRAQAICSFCDTDFVGTDGERGGRYDSAHALVNVINHLWPPLAPEHKFVVLTGGEPVLQLDAPLIEALHDAGFLIAVETNGTLPVPKGVDWICVSPKLGSTLVQRTGNELKLVIPQAGEIDYSAFEHFCFDHFLVQAMDGPNFSDNIQLAIAWCMAHPRWRLSLQTHKMIGIQ